MRRCVLVLLAAAGLASAQTYTLYEPERIVPRVDYTLGMVFMERWRGNRLLGVDRVLMLDEYLEYQLAQSVTEKWQEKTQRTQQQRDLAADASGLIPDIELPRLPIFGEGSKIDISGRDRITLGGRQTVVRGGVETPGRQRGLIPELKMEQQLSVVLNGTIGERTKVNIDHDSERDEAQNKVMLSYTGTEDEVVQSVELGDTRLAIPGTAYTGDLPARKGLFGASARGKLGGVDVYAVASREQSQSQTQTFQGQRRTSVDTIYSGQYVPRRFYRIPAPGPVKSLRVYVDDRNPGNNQSALKGIATVFPDFPESLPGTIDEDRQSGDFDLKTFGQDYYVRPNNVLEFASPLNPNEVVGLSIVTTDNESIGGYSWRGDTVILALLKPQRSDTLSLTWDYQLRNVYSLPQGEVTLNSLRLFRYAPEGQHPDRETDGRRFTEILGLDPNGDDRPEYPEFEKKTGLIIFPGLKPFDSSALSVREPVIYRKDPYEYLPGEGRRYYMVAEYSSATESYYLGQPDITEGSERVTVNGEQWTKDDGYSINYKTGVLTFLKPLPVNANIQVTFEYRPLFSLADKSLVGTRAEYRLLDQGKVGASVFYRNEGLREEKPSLGSEPFRRMICEADASWTASSNAVTAFIDRLPLVRAQVPTTFNAAAEGAVSLPDPNTRGVAYLDDFEGTQITRDVSTTSILWFWASPPQHKDTASFAATPLFWTNPSIRVRLDTIFGPSLGVEGRERRDFLRVVFTPDTVDAESSWAGITTSPSQIGMNLADIEDLRVVLKTSGTTGRLHFSVGTSIDEDHCRRTRSDLIAGRDGRLNSEDLNFNGQLDEGMEDGGLDGIYAADTLFGRLDTADDFNDDYDLNENPMGTERNGRLDGEDLDRNGFSMYNHYFECAVSLDDERYFSTLYNGWRLLRVPLMDSTVFRTVGKPRWEDIRLIRLWFDGFSAADTIDLYSIEFIGSRWSSPTLSIIRDTNVIPVDTTEKVWVTQISRRTDTTYTSPFELNRNAQGQIEQEAAMLMGYRNLYGNRRAVVSKLSSEREDYRDYVNLRVYVHDDGNDLGFLLRLGSDSANFYEYSSPVTAGRLVPGRDGKWYEFVIALDSFPWLKARRDSFAPAESLWRRGRYAVQGRPSLSDVRYTALGIENSTNRKLASGGIWFNDLRLTSPRKEPGYGFQTRVNLGLSDFASIGLTFGYSDPNFRRFSEGRGVKAGGFGTNTGLGFRASLDRLLPYGWGLSLPFSYSVADQRESPKFDPVYPDLRVARGTAAASSGHSEDIALENVHKNRSGSKVLNYTLEAMGASWRQRRARSQTALTEDSSWASTIAWSYAVSPDLKFSVGREEELSYFPQSIRLAVSDARRNDFRGSRFSPDSAMRVDTLRGHGLSTDFGVEYSPLDDLNFDYSVNTERDLLVKNPDTVLFLLLGSEAGRDHSFNAGYSMDIGDWLSPSIDFSGDYSDERPKQGATYADVRNMSNSGDIDVSLNLDLPELLTSSERAPTRPSRRPARRDTTGRDSSGLDTTAVPPARPRLRLNLGALGRALEPLDVSYSFSRSSNLVAVYDVSPWNYRLGFTDIFTFKRDSERLPTSAVRDRDRTFRLSSGARVKELTTRVGFDWADGRTYNNAVSSAAFDQSTTWPDIDLSLARVHALFKKLATDSKLSCRFRRRATLAGELQRDSTGAERLGTFGRTENTSNEFSPLLSWQTTWKRRITTTLAANYSFSRNVSYLSDDGLLRSVADGRNRSFDFNLSYAFAAPQGVKLPFLRRLRFSSDLTLTWTMRYSQASRVQTPWDAAGPGKSSDLQRDNSLGTTVAASYRFSRSIEAGLNTGYSRNRGLSPTTTESTNLEVWVLFRF
jgi:hypothetical protein